MHAPDRTNTPGLARPLRRADAAYWQPARNARAGAAVGAVILALWLGALGVTLATDDDAHDTPRGSDPAAERIGPGAYGDARR
jgi:hypothetical protein